MKNTQLKNIIDQACMDLCGLAYDGEDDIIAACDKAQAEAALQESKPKFNLGFTISIDPDNGSYETKLSWSVKQSLSAEHTLDDPAQTKLPIGDKTTLEIVTGSESTGPVPVNTMNGVIETINRKFK